MKTPIPPTLRATVSRALCLTLCFTLSGHASLKQAIATGEATQMAQAETRWRSLFNGTDLEGWEYRGRDSADSPKFTVENGAIVGRTVMPWNPTAFVCTTEQFKDFELIFEVKLTGDLNSGVQIRSTPEGPVRGAQVELENDFHRTGFIFGQGMGMWLSDEADFPENNESYKSGQWNEIRVLAEGKRIRTWINGQPTADTTHEKIALEGVIGLQVHAYPRGKRREQGADAVLSAAWRNIKIREME